MKIKVLSAACLIVFAVICVAVLRLRRVENNTLHPISLMPEIELLAQNVEYLVEHHKFDQSMGNIVIKGTCSRSSLDSFLERLNIHDITRLETQQNPLYEFSFITNNADFRLWINFKADSILATGPVVKRGKYQYFIFLLYSPSDSRFVALFKNIRLRTK